ncbi:RHS repeat-associated core domain-containing protein [Chryseobacterium sp. WX]|uniref:RHS repeat-associated core domain-containing protein n=1 Tax=Chryseobacterium sp. WX TaxID=3031803 RepID=UPI00240A59EC|nr:RHS repeat-associated core domain-containing protein [Chryseobacterium sp. WX]WFB67671.1 RHS repeat-associated core domain-containing protein [Chryseobacterium sp. WX]
MTSYLYRADGVKVKKLFGDIEADYLDGFQYKSTKPSESSVGGIGSIDDPNDVAQIKLRIIPTSEGYYDALLNQYVYNFTDHLGNVRLSYTDTNKDGIIQPRQYFSQTCDGPFIPPFQIPNCISTSMPGEIVEINTYYPFGLLHNYTATTQNAYQYKYQEQELQETGFYSFKWRNYMPDVGRFFNIDPLSEKYSYQSHYNFSENRVIDARELEGLEAILLKDNEHNIAIIKTANNGQYADNPKTKTIHIFAHGNPSAFYNENVSKDSGKGTVNTGKGLNGVLEHYGKILKTKKVLLLYYILVEQEERPLIKMEML